MSYRRQQLMGDLYRNDRAPDYQIQYIDWVDGVIMTQFVFYAHSGWRYFVIAMTVIAVLFYAFGLARSRPWGAWEQRIGMALPIVYDIQLLLGLVLWIMATAWSLPPRSAWEHPLTMLVSVGIVHVTWVRVKGANADRTKFQTALIGLLVAGAVMALGVWRITSR